MMAKKKKKKQSANGESKQSGFKRFVSSLKEAVDLYPEHLFPDVKALNGTKLDKKFLFGEIGLEYAKELYKCNIIVNKAHSKNRDIASKEIKAINLLIRDNYHRRDKTEGNPKYSTYLLKFLLNHVTYKRQLFVEGEEKDEVIDFFLDMMQKTFFDWFADSYRADIINAVSEFYNPMKKHYFIKPEFARKAVSESECTILARPELATPLLLITPEIKYFNFEGKSRPTYRLSDILLKFKRLCIDRSLLKDNYQGDKDELPVYIQAHALNRMKERLDILSEGALNHSLWKNVMEMDGIFSYRNNLYLPFHLYESNVGYLVSSIIEDCLVFRSFIFVTHNATPEGDKLRELSGLGWHDIKYWKIDRLSTLVRIGKEDHPDLKELFSKTGIEVNSLADKDFGKEALVNSNLEKLSEYILKGQNKQTVQFEDFKKFLEDSMQTELV